MTLETTPIGGYLPLELPAMNTLPHADAYPVDLGRTGLRLIVERRGYRRVWLPAYTCPVVFETLAKIGVEYVFYPIDAALNPIFDRALEPDEAFLAVDYFGVKDKTISTLSHDERLRGRLIADLTQAFFYAPEADVDAFNSVRKFVGVPDGGFVFGSFVSQLDLPRREAFDCCLHLLKRADGRTEAGYADFKAASAAMCDWEPRQISLLSEKILRSISLDVVAARRRQNFTFLHTEFEPLNELAFDLNWESFGPICYPLLVKNGDALKKRLVEQKIFIPTYWPGLHLDGTSQPVEKRLLDDLICLPVDQNVSKTDLQRAIALVEGEINVC